MQEGECEGEAVFTFDAKYQGPHKSGHDITLSFSHPDEMARGLCERTSPFESSNDTK